MKRALISVSDKKGIVEFARELSGLGFEIVSTGGTARTLSESGIEVVPISDVTGLPEILDGRVKTLHPRIHGGLLARRDEVNHVRQVKDHGIEFIDLVVVNLYPFQKTIENPEASLAEVIENIDIGGPSMLRSAAKNHDFVTVVVDPEDYEPVLSELREKGETTPATRQRLAAKVFRHTAAYDALIAGYLTRLVGEEYPERYTLTFTRVQELRYGENPHQKAAFYAEPIRRPDSIVAAKQLHGKELSYNNINDADAAVALLREFDEPAVVALKHTNPCGVGRGNGLLEAFQRAYESDPVSIFGGIVAANQVIDADLAHRLHEIFLEIVIAPGFSQEAFAILAGKKNLRLLQLPEDWKKRYTGDKQVRGVTGGLLVQDVDLADLDEANLKVVTRRAPSPEEMVQLRLAWKVVKHVKSNAIVLVKDSGTVGIGAGQMNRVGAAIIAINQAREKARGSVMGSDAFFPMPDTVEEAAKAGVTAIIQPGGSIRDEDSVKEADKHGIAMVFTGIRHFKH